MTSRGHNESKLGKIPVGWDVQPLGWLDPFVTSGSRGWARLYAEFGSAFVRITNLRRSSIYLDLADLKRVRIPQGDAEGQRTALRDGDLLISITADIGIIGYVDESVEKPAYINQHIALVRLDPNRVHSRFVAYYLASFGPQRGFRAATDQGAKAGMNLAGVRAIETVLPPPAEQRAIAAALSDVDALIGSLDQLIAKKRDLKQAAMQQLLTGQTRLPGFSGKWETKSLHDLAGGRKDLFDDGDWIEAEFLEDSGVRLIQTGNVGVGRFEDKASRKYISSASFTKLRCKALEIGDVLICRLAEPAGRACILPDLGETRMITSVDVTIFRPLSTMADRRFLVQLFGTRPWLASVNERCGGSTRTRIARGQLGRIEVELPSAEEQAAIANVLCDMDAEITALEARRDKTKLLKIGMMQELLTGRTRLV